MSARYELYSDKENQIRFRLVAADGAVVLTSKTFETEDDAIAGIWCIRETAVSGGIVDLTASGKDTMELDRV